MNIYRFHPDKAEPTAIPVRAFSDKGVSKTLFLPNFS